MAEDGLAPRYRTRTRYQPLVDDLATRDERAVVLTFPEIEAMIGVPLAVSASVETDYWSDRRHEHVRGWEALGWRARLDRRNGRVQFTREESEG
jgi:hypothetical protein